MYYLFYDTGYQISVAFAVYAACWPIEICFLSACPLSMPFVYMSVRQSVSQLDKWTVGHWDWDYWTDWWLVAFASR